MGLQRDVAPHLPFRTINVIFVASKRELGSLFGVITISPQSRVREEGKESKQTKTKEEPTLGFFEADKMGTFEPHDNALVVTLQIREFDMKRVMVDQGSGAKIMYLDLYKGLGLKPKDLDKYDIFWLDLMGKP